MGVNPPYTIADALANLHRLDSDYWRALVATVPGGLDLLPACPGAGFERKQDPEALCQLLQFARGAYTWTVVDLGSGLDPAFRAARGEIDVLFLVTTPDVLALYQCIRTIRNAEATGFEKSNLRLVVNLAGSPQPLAPADIEKAVGLPVFATVPDKTLAGKAAFRLGIAELAAGITGARVGKAPARSLWRQMSALFQQSLAADTPRTGIGATPPG
jgi:pilus assembly protein CpaE